MVADLCGLTSLTYAIIYVLRIIIYDPSVGSYTNYTIQLREDEMLKKSLLATCDERASQPYIILLLRSPKYEGEAILL